MALEIVSKLARVFYECSRFINSPENSLCGFISKRKCRVLSAGITVNQMHISLCFGKSSATELLPCDLAPLLSPGLFSHPVNKALDIYI